MFEALVERRILEAQERGEFDDLPGSGRPLPPDDAREVPAELRVAFRVLKNAGCLPGALQARREFRSLERLLASTADEGQRRALGRRLSFLAARLGLRPDSAYCARLREHLQR